MSERHAGVCVGGPYAGRHLEGEGTTLGVVERGPLPLAMTAPASETVAVKYFYYVWREPNGVGLWMPQEWDMERLLKELLNGYRPVV